MPTKKPYARIAITLPKRDLAAADRLARAQDRSRSWVVAEAIRRYASSIEAPPPQVGSSVRAADETPAIAPGLGASRLAQLRSDFSLTPEARIRAAEQTLLLNEERETPRAPRAHQVVAFDRYEDFLDWKRMRRHRE